MLRLPVQQRYRFKKPFGTLYSDISEIIHLISDKTTYTVGDVVTSNLIMQGISPKVAIIDGHTMRMRCSHTPILIAPRIVVENPPGTITDDLISAIKKAVANPPALIIVKGEEDLAVIPLVFYAPEGVIVLYGQPGEGVVVREVTGEAKEEAKEMLQLFERTDDPSMSSGTMF